MRDGSHVRVPAETFYWCLLNTEHLPGPRRPSQEQLQFLLEPFVPLPIDKWYAAFLPVRSNRYVGCAVEIDRIRELTDQTTITLTPEEIPPFIREESGEEIDPKQLNLLSGTYTSPRVKAARKRLMWLSQALVILFVLSLTLGLERRRLASAKETGALHDAIFDMQRNVLGPRPAGSRLPPSLRLEAERRSLRQTRKIDAPALSSGQDITPVLASIFGIWPKDPSMRTQTLIVHPEHIHIQGELGSSLEAEAFASPFRRLEGWRLSQPSIRASGAVVRTSLDLRPQDTSGETQ